MSFFYDLDVCQNCGKFAEEMMVCEGCELASYCSEDCRREHREDVHKEACQRFQVEKESAACQEAHGEKENEVTRGIVTENRTEENKEDISKRRDFRLFGQWVHDASGALSVYCRFTSPAIENFDSEKHAFFMEVDFDFNQKNFRPVRAAEIVEVDAGAVRLESLGENDRQKGVVPAKIRYREYELEVPIFLNVDMRENSTDEPFDQDYPDKYGELNLRHKIFNSVHLESSVFGKWARQEQENRHRSRQHLLSNKDFVQFVIHAYHLPSCQPRYTPVDHVLAVTVTFGFTLGQIECPHNFFLLPRVHVFEKLRHWYHLTPKAAKSVETQCQVATSEDSVDMAVILLAHVSNKLSVHHIKVSRWQILCKKILRPTSCDQKTKSLFAKARTRPMLELKSPDLNDMSSI